ncbi:hypothetical protein GH714_007995 [Hevea brasiliensis]|uniref:Uncharacterized protein n=1 Tax=Hevea brasiliensis TaxID=3981 RepID=A0A6A6LF69_HEVBR|nr:hypothetical protein GH714_007995 [Hevea brasiliensis]
MDVHVIDEDVGMGHRVMVYDGDAEPNEGEEAEHSSHMIMMGQLSHMWLWNFILRMLLKLYTMKENRGLRNAPSSEPNRATKNAATLSYAYERALENWFERELEADFDTICTTPVLRTPSPMEKQAANFYTRKIFAKFQEELVETFVYTANKIEGDGAISTFRHVLTVFTVTNVLTLPSHYILKDGQEMPKTGTGIDEHGGELYGQESLTLRYNNLCGEAIRYAEEGAIAVDTYNVAIGVLREGGKKIAAMKKNVAKIPPPISHVGGIGYDDRKTSTSASDTTPLLWPRQDEVTRQFNLNDAGAQAQSVTDLNLPRMAPVSLQRDDGPPGNMAVLPCLKSMTWVMENKNSTPGNRVAVINLKLQDYSKTPSTELEVKFQLSRVKLEPMLRSMAYISEQLSTPANRVAVINLKVCKIQFLDICLQK